MNIIKMIKSTRGALKRSALGWAAVAVLGMGLTANALVTETAVSANFDQGSTGYQDDVPGTEVNLLADPGTTLTLSGGAPANPPDGGGGTTENWAALTDGSFGLVPPGGGGGPGEVYIENNWILTYTFASPQTIGDIDVFSGWGDGGRKDPNVTIKYSTDGSNFTDLHTINYAADGNSAWVHLTDIAIPDVVAVQFAFGVQQNDGVGYPELSVKSGVPPGPPAAPTGLAASPLHHGVRLDWTAPIGATGYKVYRGTETGVYDPTAIATTTSVTYQDKDPALVDGTTYYYVVKGTNTFGEGNASDEAFASPSADPVDQTITFGALPAKTYGNANFDLTATASSELAVVFTSLNLDVATVSGNTVTIQKAGTATIRASQGGNGDFNAATPVDQVLTVSMADQTITFTLGLALVKQVNAAPFPDTATGGASGNPVTYLSSNEGVATVNSSGLITIVGLGVTQIRANQLGVLEYYNAAPEVTQSITVIPPLAMPVSEGVVCWFDASVGIMEDENGVLTWDDQSGLGHHATRASGTPTRVADQLNGQPAVQFRQDHFNLAEPMFTAQQYLVLKSPGIYWTGGGTFMGPSNVRIYDMFGGGEWGGSPGNWGGFWTDPAPFAVARNGFPVDPHFGNNFGYPLNPINEYMLLKINVNTTQYAANGAGDPQSYQLGRSADAGYVDFDVCEIIAYDHVLSTGDEKLLTAYLGSKFGLPVAAGWTQTALDVSASGTGAEILNDGKFIEANHLGSSPANPAVLANGLTFGISTDRLIRPNGPNFQAEWEYNGSQTYQTGWSHGASDSRGIADAITDSGFKDLMRSVWWVNYSGSRSDMEITGLTVGNTYRLQLISENPQSGTVSVEGSWPYPWMTGAPSVLSITWVATDDTLNMQYSKRVSHRNTGEGQGGEVMINGYALHDITPIPPGTVIMIR
ncbi:MAG: hypothetical protein WCK89_17910 [bacterium]